MNSKCHRYSFTRGENRKELGALDALAGLEDRSASDEPRLRLFGFLERLGENLDRLVHVLRRGEGRRGASETLDDRVNRLLLESRAAARPGDLRLQDFDDGVRETGEAELLDRRRDVLVLVGRACHRRDETDEGHGREHLLDVLAIRSLVDAEVVLAHGVSLFSLGWLVAGFLADLDSVLPLGQV